MFSFKHLSYFPQSDTAHLLLWDDADNLIFFPKKYSYSYVNLLWGLPFITMSQSLTEVLPTCCGLNHEFFSLIGCQMWCHSASTRPACSGLRRQSSACVGPRRPSTCSAAPAPTRPPPACRGQGRLERPLLNSDPASPPARKNTNRIGMINYKSKCKGLRHLKFLFYFVNFGVKGFYWGNFGEWSLLIAP